MRLYTCYLAAAPTAQQGQQEALRIREGFDVRQDHDDAALSANDTGSLSPLVRRARWHCCVSSRIPQSYSQDSKTKRMPYKRLPVDSALMDRQKPWNRIRQATTIAFGNQPHANDWKTVKATHYKCGVTKSLVSIAAAKSSPYLSPIAAVHIPNTSTHSETYASEAALRIRIIKQLRFRQNAAACQHQITTIPLPCRLGQLEFGAEGIRLVHRIILHGISLIRAARI